MVSKKISALSKQLDGRILGAAEKALARYTGYTDGVTHMGLKRGCAKSEDISVSNENIDRITELQKRWDSVDIDFDSNMEDFREAMVSSKFNSQKNTSFWTDLAMVISFRAF